MIGKVVHSVLTFPIKKTLREDATRCMRNMTAYGSLHLARKAEQVPQGLREFEGDLSAFFEKCVNCTKNN